MDTDEQNSFLHRGHRVTIAHWTDAGRTCVHAEIHLGNKLVCVLSRSGLAARAPKLLAGLHAAAIKWAEHHAAVSTRPSRWIPAPRLARP
jgi:hypothetical protein